MTTTEPTILHKSLLEAAIAYDAIARQLFGSFGTFNFPRDGERGAIAEEVAA